MTPIPIDQRRATRERVTTSLSKDTAYQIGAEENESLPPRLVKAVLRNNSGTVIDGQEDRLVYSEHAGVYRLLWHAATFVDNAGYIGSGDPNEASNISAINNSKNYHGKISTDVITALRNILQWMHGSTSNSYTVTINDIQAEGITTISPTKMLAYSPSITGDFSVSVDERYNVRFWVDMSAFGIPKRFDGYGYVGEPISYYENDFEGLKNDSRFTFTGWKLSGELAWGEDELILLKQNGEDSVIYMDNGSPKIHAHWENAPPDSFDTVYIRDFECDFPISVSPVFSADVMVWDNFETNKIRKVHVSDICTSVGALVASLASSNAPSGYYVVGGYQGDDWEYEDLIDSYTDPDTGVIDEFIESECIPRNRMVKDLNLNIPLRIVYSNSSW